jgi:hypothetical protein
MKGDFTRFGFDSSKHYSRVLQQQGRVALDADGNEASAIMLHHLRMLTKDLYSSFGGPPDSGFALVPDASSKPWSLRIGPGHYWVNGILVENEGWVDYAHQPDFLLEQPDNAGAGGDPLLRFLQQPSVDVTFWLYLDIWERHVSWVEDDSVREPALGGPDTCSRAQVVWQVKALPWNVKNWGASDAEGACGAALPDLPGLGTAQLAARTDPGPAFTDPCIIVPGAAYRGAANQLYRVEVHAGGDATTASFKWSRENGSVVTRWLGNGSDAAALLVKSSRGFTSGDWVELTHDALEFAGLPGTLVKLSVIDGDQLTVDASSGSAPVWSAELSNPRVRRWDQRGNDVLPLREGAVPIIESTAAAAQWIDLEDGVQIIFEAGRQYRSGDYWLIPARVATQGITWPQEDGLPALQLAQGAEHAYAPLGVLRFNGQQIQVLSCRRCAGLGQVTCVLPPSPIPAADNRVVATRFTTGPKPSLVSSRTVTKRKKP